MSYVPLHLHTEYSLLDGAIKVKKLCAFCKEQGWPAVAITDHGVIQAFPFCADAVEDADSDLKLIYGCEGYLVKKNAGRFRVYAFVPSAVSPAERDRLRRSGVAVRPSIEPSGNGLYKSFAYEIFKRRPSLLLACLYICT